MHKESALGLEQYFCKKCQMTMGVTEDENAKIICIICNTVLCDSVDGAVMIKSNKVFCGRCQLTTEVGLSQGKEDLVCLQCNQKILE